MDKNKLFELSLTEDIEKSSIVMSELSLYFDFNPNISVTQLTIVVSYQETCDEDDAYTNKEFQSINIDGHQAEQWSDVDNRLWKAVNELLEDDITRVEIDKIAKKLMEELETILEQNEINFIDN